MAGHEHFNLRESHSGESHTGDRNARFPASKSARSPMAGLKTAHQGKIAISAKLVLFMFGEQSRIGTRAKSFLGVCVKGLWPLCRHGWIGGMGGVWRITNTQIHKYKIHKYTYTKTPSVCQRSGHSVDMVGLLGWVVFGGFLLVCLEDSSSSLANNSFLSAILLLCPLRFKN